MANYINILLTQDIYKLGYIGDITRVKSGYARNFLYHKKMAVPISHRDIKEIKNQKKIITAKTKKIISISKKIKNKLGKLEIYIKTKVGINGKLFGSVSSRTIAKFAKKAGYNIDYKNIKLDSPIKKIGTYVIQITLEAHIKANIKIIVISDKKHNKINN